MLLEVAVQWWLVWAVVLVRGSSEQCAGLIELFLGGGSRGVRCSALGTDFVDGLAEYRIEFL